MFCKKCGAQLKENAKFCGVCGTPLAAKEVSLEKPAEPVQAAPVQAAADPFAQAAPVQPVADPFAQAAPVQPVADPFAQAAPVQAAADPFAQAAPVQPVADPFAAAEPVQAAADPFAPGTPVQPAQPQQWGTPMQPAGPANKNKTPLILAICGGALLVVILAVVLLLFSCGGGGASSADEAVEEYFNALNDEDFGAIEDVMYPTAFQVNYDEDLFTEKEFVEMLIEEVHPGDEDEPIIFGSSKITDTEKYSNSEIKLMNKELEDEDGYIEIEKYVRATGTIDIKVDGEKNTYEFSAYIIKAGGSWYIASMTVYSWPIGD